MKKSRKYGVILLLAVILPGLFFSVYEIGSLNQNEKNIEEIYNNQLAAIIYSVNQYSQDVASSWAVKMNNVLNNPYGNFEGSLKQFTSKFPSIQGVFYTSDTARDAEVILQNSSINIYKQRLIIQEILDSNYLNIRKLYQYIKGGYQKIEVFNSSKSSNFSYFVFIAEDYYGHNVLCGIIIDSQAFVKQVLASKIQSIVEEKFIIGVLNGQKNNAIIYISEPTNLARISKVKPLWLLPNYNLGIINKNKTIEQLVRERTYLNFALFILLELLFLTGTWYAFRSIRTQIQLAQMRSDFISNVSHEIRTPLSLISVYIETILLGRLQPKKMQEYYQIIYQETNRLTGIVNKILNFSRIEDKKLVYNFKLLNINEIIESVLQRYDYHLKNNHFIVDINLGSDVTELYGDKEALFEVFMNLTDNAIKYSRDEKYIGIRTYIDNHKLIAEISDRGIGIPENQQKYIFDKFFRVTNGEVQSVRGSGLGLAIVKHIMEGHNAAISLLSSSGKGSTFRLIFTPADKSK